MSEVDQGDTLPANKRNKEGEGAESVGTEKGDAGYDTEAEARSSLRTAAMHGKDHAGRTHENVIKSVTRQFPSISADNHSGIPQGPRKSMGHAEASARRSGLSHVAPKVIPENMEGSQPGDTMSKMGGTDAPNDGDESYLDV